MREKNGDTPKWLSGLKDSAYKCNNVSRWVSGVVMNRHENAHNEKIIDLGGAYEKSQ